jgi:hypothetical protein
MIQFSLNFQTCSEARYFKLFIDVHSNGVYMQNGLTDWNVRLQDLGVIKLNITKFN